MTKFRFGKITYDEENRRLWVGADELDPEVIREVNINQQIEAYGLPFCELEVVITSMVVGNPEVVRCAPEPDPETIVSWVDSKGKVLMAEYRWWQEVSQ